MARDIRELSFLAVVFATALTTSSVLADDFKLHLSTQKAPIAPDGTTVGAVTDFVIGFQDTDPSVPGVGLKKGGSVKVTLPEEFKFVDAEKPVLKVTSAKTCTAPLMSACSSAVLLQGWPQSLIPPFPGVSYEPGTNTLTLSVAEDWMPNGVEAPGPKQLHIMGFGFQNPEKPGLYPVNITIQPDPADSSVIEGEVMVDIVSDTAATISPTSLSNGKPPPPFPNTLYQNIAPGDSSLKMAFYLWDTSGQPVVGADIVMDSSGSGRIVGTDNKVLGVVEMNVPVGSSAHELVTDGPSKSAKAFLSGVDAGHLVAELHTDPSVTGDYEIVFSMNNGNSVSHKISAK